MHIRGNKRKDQSMATNRKHIFTLEHLVNAVINLNDFGRRTSSLSLGHSKDTGTKRCEAEPVPLERRYGIMIAASDQSMEL